ncbi:hypothetical protein BN3456_02059 [Clostridium sp. C105KSO13]|nr:hypothetical protein BN3456_02059 [Clostridium sp. C105KSO13]
MTKGSGDARTQPLYFLITTAGTDTNSICFKTHQKALDLLEGRKVDPTPAIESESMGQTGSSLDAYVEVGCLFFSEAVPIIFCLIAVNSSMIKRGYLFYQFIEKDPSSGNTVTERTAMQTTAVYAYVRVLAEAIAELPLNDFQYTENGGNTSSRSIRYTSFCF